MQEIVDVSFSQSTELNNKKFLFASNYDGSLHYTVYHSILKNNPLTFIDVPAPLYLIVFHKIYINSNELRTQILSYDFTLTQVVDSSYESVRLIPRQSSSTEITTQ